MQHDVIIIGGSFAGLAAALYLARSRLSVCVIDAGKPRNRFAEHSHGLFSQDGSNPRDMIATARAQVAAYPSVSFVDGVAVDVARSGGGIAVTLEDGAVLLGSKLLLAFGVSDILPEISGIAERWGKTVIHCPYCHGFEFSGQRLGVLQQSPMSVHQALLVANWGPTTYFLNGAALPDAAVLAQFRRLDIAIEAAPIEALIGEGTQLSGVALVGGRSQAIDALYVGPSQVLNSPLAGQLGCAITAGPFSPFVAVDEMNLTSVADVYAAGDITRGGGYTVTFACADGVMAGLATHRALLSEAHKLGAAA
ncbi:MAG: trxB [Devosia sp.]|nr:trxB [Devosia sp.]